MSPRQSCRRMGAGDGRSRVGDVGGGGHSGRNVSQGRKDDGGGHKGDIPRGHEVTSGIAVEETGSSHPPPR